MSWNYRIVHWDDYASMHEVHYDDAGKVLCYTDRPRALVGENATDIIEDLELMLADARRLPALRGDEMPTGEP